jgi:alanyl-tRNA synthetase
MKSHELRSAFLDYFVAQGHTLVPSSALIPQKDPTLLFTNAGMVQFKDVFMQKEKRGYTRAVSSQKCMRVGGKHNDLENVGWTKRHHTFFEMLGNFSFGDYFKAEAIDYAWQLLTDRFHLPPDRLFITIFQDDDEAEKHWRRIGIGPERITRMGEESNFWAMGETGPCGPCSEVMYDQGEEAVPPEHRSVCRGLDCDCDRYLEIWNLVFMQYHRDRQGKLTPLPRPSIDTGMGLERITAVMQERKSNYETDLFRPLLMAVARITDRDVEELAESMAGRVIADHLRAITFLIHDGILPSNEGRGYVLRRIIRRAARYGKELGLDGPFLYRLTGEVVDLMKVTYPEMVGTRTIAAQVTQGEEERFIETLNQGLGLWHEVIRKVKQQGKRKIPGDEAFRLYDTYGFPFDLASDIAAEHGLATDEAGYQAAMEEQKERARKSWVMKEAAPFYQEAFNRFGSTPFVGYQSLEEEVRLLGILKDGKTVKKAVAGEIIELVFDRTPFYGESGGQVGDQGLLEHPSALVEIHSTQKPVQELFTHQGKVIQGEVVEGETYRAVVNRVARLGAERNHTATHILHSVLREILGEHVKQSGSLVAADRLRFDFSHFKPLMSGEIRRIEEVVNERIRADHPVETHIMNFHEALRSGALAFFDDRYGDKVRVVRIGEYSKELCGGTHCRDSGEAGLFKLIQESSIASGMRRIEAVTGEMAYSVVKRQEEDLNEVAALLKVKPTEIIEKTKRFLAAFREKERELEAIKGKIIAHETRDLSRDTVDISGVKVVRKMFKSLAMSDLRLAADSIKSKIQSGIAIVGSAPSGNSVNLFVTVTKDIENQIPANLILKGLAPLIDGKGGGRAGSAQAGGKNPGGLKKALEEDKVREAIEKAKKKKV